MVLAVIGAAAEGKHAGTRKVGTHGFGDHAFDVGDATSVTFDCEGMLVADLLCDIVGGADVGGVVDWRHWRLTWLEAGT